jgi:hypothetical protein
LAFALSIIVWLVSLVLLFYRAWDSRRRRAAEKAVDRKAALGIP